MPPIPKSLEPKRPCRTKAVKPPSREALLRSALVGILRRLGKISLVVPTDLSLIALALDFAEGGEGQSDEGKIIDMPPKRVFKFSECLSLPFPLDKDIPF